MNLSDLPTDYVQQVASYRNNIPRKSLNYKTPLEVFMKYITNEQVVFFSEVVVFFSIQRSRSDYRRDH